MAGVIVRTEDVADAGPFPLPESIKVLKSRVEAHAVGEIDPVGDDWPLGHAVHATAVPPAEYVLAAHKMHEVPLR